MATIQNINAGDLISASRADLNTNFTNLNNGKIETTAIDTDTSLAANSDTKIASQKAVKAYVDAGGNVNASTTAKGIVQLATAAEFDAGTATGSTGAFLVVTASVLKGSSIPTIQTFTASGTWTKPAGLKYVMVELVGGGGAGGGTNTNSHGAPGGGAGGYSRKRIAAGTLGSTETVTVGAGGTGVSASAGNTGVTTSFGAHASATGGVGGGANGNSQAGGGGVGSSGDVNITGGAGGSGSNAVGGSGAGGSSLLGGGGRPVNLASNGNVGGTYGGGGSGSITLTGSTAFTGGAGAAGVVIVTEYYV